MGIFDIIFSEEFPAKHHQMYLVSRLLATEDEIGKSHNIKIKLVSKDTGEELVDVQATVSFEKELEYGDFLAINNIIVVRNVVFNQEGVYRFEIYVDDELKGMTPLYVGQRKSYGDG